ncbi:MAG: hypothetical protein ABEJ83_02810 [Candidatus Nanohaloarchaea archaeon]
MSKGQTISIDWMIGLSLFLTASLTAAFAFSGFQFTEPQTVLEKNADSLQQEIKENISVKTLRAPLIVRSSHKIENIVLDRKFVFEEFTASGFFDTSSEIDLSNNRLIAIIDAKDTEHHLTLFKNLDVNRTASNNLRTGNWLNNSRISIHPTSSGISSLQFKGEEMLSQTSDLGFTDDSTSEKHVYASSYSGNLRIYNNSPEILIKNSNAATFYFKNFTTLYWGETDSSQSLSGTGTFKSGETPGFTLANSSESATFVGDMNAEISKPDPSTVKAVINAEKFKIRLQDSGVTEGIQRINFHENGTLKLGARRYKEFVWKKKIGKLRNLTRIKFERRFNLESVYNITISSGNSTQLDRGYDIPIENVVVDKRSWLAINRSGDLERISSRVVVWQ